MKALYFGTYDRAAPRNTQVVSCLRGAGVEVVERHREVWGRQNWSLGLGSSPGCCVPSAPRARKRSDDADVVVVGYPGHFDLPAARRIARGRPIVFNPLVSLHDTLVGDRARFRRARPRRACCARRPCAFRAADLVVADTEAHAAFFRGRSGSRGARRGRPRRGRGGALPAGVAPPEPFHALFVGKLIPLHGLETILAAAALVPEIPFRVVGDGQLAPLLERGPPNVEHVPWIPYAELPEAYRGAGAPSGSSARARRRPA